MKTLKNTKYEFRNAAHPSDAKEYDTGRLRDEFLITKLFEKDTISLVYTGYDRFIAGGIYPVNNNLVLESFNELKADYFLERREAGIINIGGSAVVSIDGQEYTLERKEALYIGRGAKEVIFSSRDKKNPPKIYFNSAPAHANYPVKKVSLKDADTAQMGSAATSNARKINKLIVNSVVQTCQLQMGLTEFEEGSVWNTMPVHTHNRRMEVYFYFEVAENQAVCHFMGDPKETRHIWVGNEEAVISPVWSIHAGVGTGKYAFIWGMAGENLNYGDMDVVQPGELR